MKLKEMLDDVKVKEIDDDMRDLDLGNVGSELDKDDDLAPGFKQQPMITQVMKVLDSRGNPKPVETVTTDDGKEHKITASQASTLKMFLTADYDSKVKRQFTSDVQQSDTLAELLKGKTPQEMQAIFLDKYKPQGREKSNYS